VIPYQEQLPIHTRDRWETAHWSLGFNRLEKHSEAYQPGGTGILVMNLLAHWALSPGADQLGLGRWSWVCLRGREQQHV